MRLWALVAVAVLGCSNAPKGDTVLKKGELGGTAITLSAREVRYKPPCAHHGLDLYKCLFTKTQKNGCVYLELGTVPHHAGDDPCTATRIDRRVLLVSVADVDLELDPAGGRFAWRSGLSWQLGYVFRGQLLIPAPGFQNPNPSGVSKASAAIDWRAQKTFEEAAPTLYFDAPPELQPALLEVIHHDSGDKVVTQMLLDHITEATSAAWEPAWLTLDDAHRRQVGQQLVKSVLEDGDDDLLEFIDGHPGIAPGDFESKLREQMRLAVEGSDIEGPVRWLSRGYRNHDPEAPRLACSILEREELWNAWGDSEMVNPPAGQMPYAVIAATQTKCEAVSRQYTESPCSTELRCRHGWPPGESGTPGETPNEPWELCDASDVEKMKKEIPDEGIDDPDFDPAARMGALLAQGPLPKSFWLKNARRSYAQLRAFDGGFEDDGTPCATDATRLSNFLCGLRPETTHFTLYGCEVRLDDAAKVVRLRRVDEQDGGS